MLVRPPAALFLAACLPLSATVWHVGRASDFASVTEAVARARSGDEIRVAPGSYTGNVLLDKTIRLIGNGRPVLRGSGLGSVVTLLAPGCTVQGFRIEHSGGSLMNEDSGILLHSGGNRIIGNELRDILFGVYFFQSNDNLVSHNSIEGRTSIDQGERGAGLHFWNALRNTIEDNAIWNTRDGMYLQNASDSAIRRNRIWKVRYGLHYMYSNDNVFEDNTFNDNVAGAAIMYSTRIQLRHNRFVHNRGFSSFGILFQDSTAITAEQNIIADNETGLFAEALRASTFRNNLISGNDTAIEMFSSAEDNQFSGNNFIANLTPIRVIGRTTSTRWSGNYWSDYDGYDLDSDGIGDVPYRIRNFYEKLEGNYPRLRLYFQSPGAQALVAAERVFPIMQAASETDPRPLMRPADAVPSLKAKRAHPEAAKLAGFGALGAFIFAGAVLFRRKGVSA